eukprot:COSAG01_NODE_3813_length_5675_cov_25.731970_1_plen_85_part_00
MVVGGMVKGVILGHPGATHAVEERRLGVGVGRVQLMAPSATGGRTDSESPWPRSPPGRSHSNAVVLQLRPPITVRSAADPLRSA